MIFNRKPWSKERSIVQRSEQAYEGFYGGTSAGTWATESEAYRAIQELLEGDRQKAREAAKPWN